jgi:thymidylate synthase
MRVYLDMLRYILDNGELISNGRTKEGYISVFGYQNRYNLREGFPLVITKRVPFRLIERELSWFLRGDTNIKYLQDNNVHIWDEWATAEQTAKFGRPEGELGPVYGELWRRWGKYEADVCLEGIYHDEIDQIQRVVDRIKTNPSCRRLIVTGWNPVTCDKVALPPCHTLFQFKVSHGGTRLNCQLYQRSADAFLGVPFNIASYALLTHMIAQVTGLEVGEFIHTFGDLHIYEGHMSVVQEQLTRNPLPLPQLWLDPTIKNIDDFKPEHIKLLNYSSHSTLKADVAI